MCLLVWVYPQLFDRQFGIDILREHQHQVFLTCFFLQLTADTDMQFVAFHLKPVPRNNEHEMPFLRNEVRRVDGVLPSLFLRQFQQSKVGLETSLHQLQGMLGRSRGKDFVVVVLLVGEVADLVSQESMRVLPLLAGKVECVVEQACGVEAHLPQQTPLGFGQISDLVLLRLIHITYRPHTYIVSNIQFSPVLGKFSGIVSYYGGLHPHPKGLTQFALSPSLRSVATAHGSNIPDGMVRFYAAVITS